MLFIQEQENFKVPYLPTLFETGTVMPDAAPCSSSESESAGEAGTVGFGFSAFVTFIGRMSIDWPAFKRSPTDIVKYGRL